jgi:hypothetical protein
MTTRHTIEIDLYELGNREEGDRILGENLSSTEYNDLLAEIVQREHGANASIMDVPGVYEACALYYQQLMVNAVIERKAAAERAATV